jgi:hypothetical protein
MTDERNLDAPESSRIEPEEIHAIRDLVSDLGKPEIMEGAWRQARQPSV